MENKTLPNAKLHLVHHQTHRYLVLVVKADSCCGGGARNSLKQRRKEREREIVCGKNRAWLLRGMVAMVVVKVVTVGIPLVRSKW